MIFLGHPRSFENFAPVQCVDVVDEVQLKRLGKKRKKTVIRNNGRVRKSRVLLLVRAYVVHGDVPSLVIIRVRSELRSFRMKALGALPRAAQLQRVRVLSVDRVSVAHCPKHAHGIVLRETHTHTLTSILYNIIHAAHLTRIPRHKNMVTTICSLYVYYIHLHDHQRTLFIIITSRC